MLGRFPLFSQSCLRFVLGHSCAWSLNYGFRNLLETNYRRRFLRRAQIKSLRMENCGAGSLGDRSFVFWRRHIQSPHLLICYRNVFFPQHWSVSRLIRSLAPGKRLSHCARSLFFRIQTHTVLVFKGCLRQFRGLLLHEWCLWNRIYGHLSDNLSSIHVLLRKHVRTVASPKSTCVFIVDGSESRS